MRQRHRVDVDELRHRIEGLEGVTATPDVHVWTLVPGYDVLTAHVLVDPEHEDATSNLPGQIREIACNDFNLQHVTVQVE